MKKNVQFVSIIITFVGLLFLYNPSFVYAAMSGDSGNDKANLYKEAERFVLRAKKLEKKDKVEKALKLYSKAYDKLLKAYNEDKKNPDILNYLGFTLRKAGNFEDAEKFYLEGLKIDPEHIGINEYLGELYISTNRLDKAKERLKILETCNCEEYSELKNLINQN
jgi:tetratricopeptide (TPR) repeat protein